MSNIQANIDSTYIVMRTILTEADSLSTNNTVSRIKIENSIRKNLEILMARTNSLEKASQAMPIHEKSRILMIVKEFRENHRKISESLKPNKTNTIELSIRTNKEDFSSLSNTEIQKKCESMKQKQDQDIDKLIETVENVKISGKNIGDELELHIKLLEDTEKTVDNTTLQISNTSERMMRLVDKSSNKCLIMIIIILLILIFLTLFYL